MKPRSPTRSQPSSPTHIQVHAASALILLLLHLVLLLLLLLLLLAAWTQGHRFKAGSGYAGPE